MPVLNAISLFSWTGALLWGMTWYFDTEPPIKMSSYTTTPAYPGGTMLVVADVKRALDRECDATYSVRFVDSRGVSQPIESSTPISANSIRGMDEKTPGKLMFAVPIADWTPSGMGEVVVPLMYTCNPYHRLGRPIGLSLVMKGEVLAP